MSMGYFRLKREAAQRFDEPLPWNREASAFTKAAIQKLHEAVSDLLRSEQVDPGSSNGAITDVRDAMAKLYSRKPSPTLMEIR